MIKFVAFIPIGAVLFLMIGNELYLWLNRKKYIDQGRKVGMEYHVSKEAMNHANKYVLKGIKLGTKEREITDKLMGVRRHATHT